MSSSARARGPELPGLHWAIGVIGMLVVAGVIGFMLLRSATESGAPPRITIEPQSVVPLESGFLVKLRLRNEGGEAAADVLVEGTLHSAQAEIESSHATVRYLPAGSEREAGLFFTQDPSRYELRVRPEGYEPP